MTMIKMPPLLGLSEIALRLQVIFPKGAPNRNYCTRDIAAATVFAMLYVGAVDDVNRYLAPKQVYKMSDEQALLISDAERISYAVESVQPRFQPRGSQWYADNTREPIRDETLRKGLIAVGAAVERKDIATTSTKPRYALARDFATLFDPKLTDGPLMGLIAAWQEAHLSRNDLTRLTIVRAGRSKNPSNVIVALPNGDTRSMKPGASSVIAKHVIEEFAPRFLSEPAVILISESGNKVFESDNTLAQSIKLVIDPSRSLPDIILADLKRPLSLVFVEVVATDGPISKLRKRELLDLARDTAVPPSHIFFVTAYMDRNDSCFKRNMPDLAWDTFVWCASEPSSIIVLHGDLPHSFPSVFQRSAGLKSVK